MKTMSKAMAREIIELNKKDSKIAHCVTFGQIHALLAAGTGDGRLPPELTLSASDTNIIEAALVLAGFKIQ